MPSRILLTGASGFVGGHLVPRLAAAFPRATVSAQFVDLTDVEAVTAYVRSTHPDAAIHLAAIADVASARADPMQTWQVNLHGTLALANALMREAPDALLVHISSADCYGRSFAAGAPLDEHAMLVPMNAYAASKAAADLALGAMVSDGLRCIRLRPFNHTGPGQSPSLVVAAFAQQIVRIEAGLQPPRLKVGALDPQRDFLDVRDVCDAYVACLQRADTLLPGTILNIASGVPRRIGDILDQLLAIAGVSADIETGEALLRPSEIRLAHGNASAACTALGWRPMIPWERTLRDVIDDWRERVRTDA